jgi:hypothetical protein
MPKIQKTKIIFLAIIFFGLFGLAGNCLAANYYVGTDGNDTNPGTYDQPFASISQGISVMAGGDTLIVKNGTYSGTANFITGVPNGSVGAYTTIKAENLFEVRITRGMDNLLYYDNPIRMSANSYVEVEGFILDIADDSTPPSVVAVTGSDHIKLKKFIVKRSGVLDQYANIVAISGGSTYVLLEDCGVTGGMRYGIYAGGTADTSRYIILRRCVVRNDYSNSTQPKAAFATYGNNAGIGIRDVLYQNTVAIDGQNTWDGTGDPSSRATYAGYYNPKNAADVTYKGTMVLNNYGYWGGMGIKELSGTNMTLDNCLIWDSGENYGLRLAGNQDYVSINKCTIGGNAAGFYHASSPIDNHFLKNTLFYNNTSLSASNYGWATESNNGFNPVGQARGTNPIASTDNLEYITRIEAGSAWDGAADDGGDVGANILNKWGADGTLWGETGYDQLTGNSLWPWPYEDKIKEVFSEANSSPAGSNPATNDTTRGFARSGTGLYGGPITLTSYIWEYLGSACPAGICETVSDITPPAAPSGLSVQ